MPRHTSKSRVLALSLAASLALLAGCSTNRAGHTNANSTASSNTSQTSKAQSVDIIAKLPTMPGNIAVSRDSRIFVSQHPFGNPTFRVVEVKPDGSQMPFPTTAWSAAPAADGTGIAAIIGIEVDQRNRLWMLDAGGPTTPPKLLAWDLTANTMVVNINLAAAAVAESFMQDFAVDLTRNHVYIADIGGIDPSLSQKPAIVVVNLANGTARRVLENHPALRAENVDMIVEGQPVQVKRPDGTIFRPRAGINPITIDATDTNVYFGSMNGTAIWRVPAAALADTNSPDLASRVQRWGTKGVSDGFNIDQEGNVYVTDLNTSTISVALAGEPRSAGYVPLTSAGSVLRWPDGVSFGGDGNLYIVVNQLHKSATLNAGIDATTPPYIIARTKPLGPALLGR